MTITEPEIGADDVREPSRESVSLDELRAAYPDPDPATEGHPGLDGGRGGRPDGTAVPTDVGILEDTTTATLVTEAKSLQLPCRTVGRVQRRRPGAAGWSHAGSGTLVGPWHVLTASHVVTGDPAGTSYRFLPAYYDGERTGTQFGRANATIVAFVGIHVDEVTGYDYMVCRLDYSLGWGWGWLGTKGSNNEGFYTNVVHSSVGYPGNLDNGERPYSNPVQINDVVDDDHHGKRLEGRSDIAKGWSGGPLLPNFADPVVGVASGADDGSDVPWEWEDVTYAGGPEMVNLVRHARDNWLSWINQPENMTASFGYTKPAPGSSVAVCSWGPGRIDLFWRSADNHLRHAWYPHDGRWSWEQDMTAQFGLTPITTDPTVSSWEPGRLDVFWRSADGHIRHIWYPYGEDWSWEQDMTAGFGHSPAKAGTSPAAVSWGPGRIDLFWISADDHIRHIWFPHGEDWSWEQDMTAGYGLTPAKGAPAVASWEPGRLDLFWRSKNDDHLKHVWYPHGEDWSWEQDMTTGYGHGPVTASPSAASWAPGRLDLFWRFGNGTIGHDWTLPGADWDRTENMTAIFDGSRTSSTPAACSWGKDRMDLFWVDSAGQLMHSWFDKS